MTLSLFCRLWTQLIMWLKSAWAIVKIKLMIYLWPQAVIPTRKHSKTGKLGCPSYSFTRDLSLNPNRVDCAYRLYIVYFSILINPLYLTLKFSSSFKSKIDRLHGMKYIFMIGLKFKAKIWDLNFLHKKCYRVKLSWERYLINLDSFKLTNQRPVKCKL